MLAELGLTPGTLSAGAIVGIVVLMVLTGRLITKSSHDREIANLQKAIDIREASNQKLLEQQAKFAELALLAMQHNSTQTEDT